MPTIIRRIGLGIAGLATAAGLITAATESTATAAPAVIHVHPVIYGD